MRRVIVVLSIVVQGAWTSMAGGAQALLVREFAPGRHSDLAQLTPALSAQASREGRPAPRSFRSLASDVSQARGAQRVRRLRIATVGAESDAEGVAQARMFRLIEQRVFHGSLRHERFPQLSYDRLVIIVQDAAGRELDWRLAPNPGIVRAEARGPDGHLQGGPIAVDSVELSIAIPDIAGADRVSIFRPRWTGAEYLLDPLGQVRLTP